MRDLIVAALMASMLASGGGDKLSIPNPVSPVTAHFMGQSHSSTTGPARFGW